MAKNCINQICEKEIPSSVTFCPFCGAQQVEDIQLSEEEKLRKEMNEMQETIALLKKTLADAQQNNDSSEKKEQQITKLQTQLQTVEEKKRTAEEPKYFPKPLYKTNNKKMFRHPFSFKGRIRRLEYCYSFLFFLILFYFVLMFYDTECSESKTVIHASADGSNAKVITTNKIKNVGFAVFLLLSLIPMIWFILAQGTKRCHDMNNSGWYQIIFLILPIYILWMMFNKGDKKINDYGEPPK
jgi:uncharacterized membrane protein YhaH (DUF805 family)